jgi:hypothetical protein
MTHFPSSLLNELFRNSLKLSRDEDKQLVGRVEKISEIIASMIGVVRFAFFRGKVNVKREENCLHIFTFPG